MNYLIKTYCFESGLWYLAKSLGDKLRAEGHTVIYAPKVKYVLRDRGTATLRVKKYFKPKNPKDFKGEKILKFSERKDKSEQIIRAVINHSIDTVISFETFYLGDYWPARVRSQTGVKVIDVPMPEWVNWKHVKSGAHAQLFDEIWCLTKYAKNRFDNYGYKYHEKAKSKTWDFVDSSIFYPPEKREGPVTFYHAASLNAEHSTKNTDKVLEAFKRFCKEENPKASLIVTVGADKDMVDNHKNIEYITDVQNRKEIGIIYRRADVVLAPSQKEGLGLNLYEAISCGCVVVTTKAPPMDEIHTKYLCEVSGYESPKAGSIKLAQVKVEEIQKQIKQAYEDIINGRR